MPRPSPTRRRLRRGPISFAAPWSVGSLRPVLSRSPLFPLRRRLNSFAQSQYIVLPDRFHAAYTIQWTFSVQRQFAHGWQAQLDYIGNTTRHDPIGLADQSGSLHPRSLGSGRHRLHGHRDHGTGRSEARGRGNKLLNDRESELRVISLTTKNPHLQGNQYLGGGGGSVLVSDNGTANYNGLVASIQPSSLVDLQPAGELDLVEVPEHRGCPGRPGRNNRGNPNNPAWITVRADPTTATLRMPLWWSGAISTLQPSGETCHQWLGIRAPVPDHERRAFHRNCWRGQFLTNVGNDRPNLVAGVAPYAEVNFRKGTGAANRDTSTQRRLRTACPSGVNGCAARGHLRKHQQELLPWAEVAPVRRPDLAGISNLRAPDRRLFVWKPSTC